MRNTRVWSTLFLCLCCVLACDSSSEETDASRQIGPTGGSGGTGGVSDGANDSPSNVATCADGVPLIQALDWVEVLAKPATAIQVVWTGTNYGVLWLASESTSGGRPLHFVRVSPEGALLGDPVRVGTSLGSSHRIVFTGARFLVSWINGRTEDDPYDGIRIGVISDAGALAEMFYDVQGTYDTKQIDLSWDSFAGGLLTYTKGAVGEGGLFATSINEDGSLDAENQIETRPISSFASTYGDSAWAVAYAVRDMGSENPILMHLLDDEGVVYDPEPIDIANQALGQVHIGFGQGNYAVTWSGLNPEGKLQPATVLLDGAAEIIGRPVFDIDADFGVVEDLLAVDTQGFVLSWNGEVDGKPILGVQVMSALGILEDPIIMEGRSGAQLSQSRLVVGESEHVEVFSTYDAEPLSIGYSSDVSVYRTRLQSCD